MGQQPQRVLLAPSNMLASNQHWESAINVREKWAVITNNLKASAIGTPTCLTSDCRGGCKGRRVQCYESQSHGHPYNMRNLPKLQGLSHNLAMKGTFWFKC
eukprot:6347288-Amphidinium_carterae.1